ncbi:MAG: cyclase family protein [Deltaproteobacteria bacterium]|nr:cyclase family protein [Deltaproteobacteria bacterium]
MAHVDLWSDFRKWQSECRWVDLSCEISPKTQRFGSFPPITLQTMYTVPEHGFKVDLHSVVGQYGTHIDAPSHFVHGARSLEQIRVEELVMPLCVIDKTKEVDANPEFIMQVADIEAWEKEHGIIQPGSFVAFQSGWTKRLDGGDMNNKDANGVDHTPGWGLDALKLLFEKRKVGAVGHEPLDTDGSLDKARQGFKGELYVLEQDHFQVEVMVNLDKCPPTGALIFCGFPKIKDSAGFPVRCYALCPKNSED